MIEYRFLLPSDFELARPMIEANGGTLPDPSQAVIFAALDGDKLVGCLPMVFVPIASLAIDPEYSDRVSWREMKEGAEKVFEQGEGFYYMFASSAGLERLFRIGGATEVQQKAFRVDV